MTRKHFVALAWELARVRPVSETPGDPAFCAWYDSVQAVAVVCSEANSAFDLDRFWSGCLGQALYRNGRRHLVPTS